MPLSKQIRAFTYLTLCEISYRVSENYGLRKSQGYQQALFTG